MTNDNNNPETASAGLADADLERLLSDAYDAPPVPRSLLKRIDRAVEAEWGRSPQLAVSRTAHMAGAFSHSARWIKPAPVVAAVVLMIAFVFLLSRDARAFAWASVVEALAKQGVVAIDGPDETRWLSLAEGTIGERTADSFRLLDLRRRVVLERRQNAAEIHRRKLEIPASAADPNRLVLGFLLGAGASEDEWNRFAGARIIDERWERVRDGGRDRVVLYAEFVTAAAERLQIELTLDPETHLPTGCEAGRETAAVALTYPPVDAGELRERELPAGLPVVDGPAGGDASVDVAASDGPPADATAENQTERRPQSNVRVNASGVEEQANAAENRDEEPEQSSLLGAASKWKPVDVVDRSPAEVVQRVDGLLADLWKQNEVEPAPPAEGSELLRRVYLDLAGRTPSVNEVRAYLSNKSGRRYEELVDRLLASPDHASHLATVWRTFLIPEGVDLAAFGGIEAFDQWLAERFASNDSYDEVVRSLLLAEGRLSRSGPLLFYSAVKLNPDQLAARTARVFLGMRLECAQCHDHPFEPWTQQDFWSYAAFFAQISRPQGELENVSTVMRVRDVDRGEVTLPETDTVVPPRFLDGASLKNRKLQSASRRQNLARWLTSGENPYFARATANRVWGHMFGKGIVDPVDDFGVQNTPISPELLDLLAGHFINTGFDLRQLFRVVALSRAYRLSSGAPTFDERRTEWFAQMHLKTLTAEQVYDCITIATLLNGPGAGNPNGVTLARFGNADREAFLRQFRTPAGQRTEYLGGIPQALTLMNGTLIENATGLSSSGLLKSLEAPFFTNEQRIEILYLATLSRPPRFSEWQLLKTYIPEEAAGAELQEGLADILWALLNSAEFTMNH